MITGVLFLALPISVLGTNFTNAWLESKVWCAANKKNSQGRVLAKPLLSVPGCLPLLSSLKNYSTAYHMSFMLVTFRRCS
jgi:hypothetical protein